MDTDSGFYRSGLPGFMVGILGVGSIQMISMIPLPWRIFAIALLLAAGIAFGFIQGMSRESDRRDAQDLQRQSDAAKALAALQVKADDESTRREAIGAERETAREQIRVVYRTIKEKANEDVTKHPEFNDCGLDADSLHNWNAANSGISETETVPGKSDYSLPDSTTSQDGKLGGSVPESYRGNGAIQPVPGSDETAGDMHQSASEGLK